MSNVTAGEVNDTSILLAKWFKERPAWLQLAAHDLTVGNVQTPEVIARYVEIAIEEASKKPGRFNPDKELLKHPSLRLQSALNGEKVRIVSIGDIEGVNQLAPRSPLQLGFDDLSVIFGNNGSGKTGYVRILKHACLSNFTEPLYGDVFARQKIGPSCTISISEGGVEREIRWVKDSQIDQGLAYCAIYDAKVAHVFVNDEKQIEYEPEILQDFTRLTDICGEVSNVIREMQEKDVTRLPKVMDLFQGTKSGAWRSRITAKTSQTDIDNECSWLATHELELSTLQKKKAKLIDPTQELSELWSLNRIARRARDEVRHILERVSRAKRTSLIKLRLAYIGKRRVADEASTVLGGISQLSGIGSDSWLALWKAAEEYSTRQAYIDLPFPYTGTEALCVFCQQPLGIDAQERLLKFRAHISGVLEKESKAAKTLLDEAVSQMSVTVDKERLLLYLGSLSHDIDQFSAGVDQLASNADELYVEAQMVDKLDELSLDLEPVILDDIYRIRLNGLRRIRALRQSDNNSERLEVDKGILELESRKRNSELEDEIEAEVNRFRRLSVFGAADRLTNTTQISTKRGELADLLVSQDYIDRFEAELGSLGASSLPLRLVKSRNQKGRTLFKIELKDVVGGPVPSNVLSDGEFRVASLASFLANLAASAPDVPFIFDDPITSLDETFEDAVIQRLITLSESRQVIVFTHRLSLMRGLQMAAQDRSKEVQISSVSKESWGSGQPRAIAFANQKYPNCWNGLISETRRAAKILEDNGTEAYEREAKWICSELRISVERLIEQVLLGGVVERYRLQIQTLGKIGALAKINSADCSLVDRMMARYSFDLHCQPVRKPGASPSPAQIEEDLQTLVSWHAEFSKRPIPVEA